ncbi:hypothetical protein [Deinococcus radiodurans]|jgi:hypothetical protein|uniref:Uncharacterized protein n=1 Tax=Deinococcus radiodurans (strain ATCC 13939 / DSM 20539 / JCM 16871 / CCUG 27074 / LMG 4051 / NBRC 15346 / NCIMB 9279 / VKM B-1422 / R1) TaxID=243230 RepID=Q9RVH9_DEIRA|nr:hypothetical protein [Deinococcus radiodurans]AAF10628.1 hypothetical protein DR_1050 [Deinococcus radiodurans R1 = ATCC 13939 = DSM 20539]QEM70537.1 hypothetical protein DXG80_01365 [Deinococcus radiodurans]QIP29140.1 hypothetical protein HAV23_08170 [Deinococcus radiodurans]QIP32162.1 hypothetical protein HAV35_08625 [Deinococcus radiodurans]UDL00189.1 hypothetical protein E5E91_05460 [Deinococcus radiodurans R1 = ATCC 13939 = DSM 20539]
MGSSPWWYVVDYQPDLQQALDALREREFQAGRYFPALDFPPFPVTPQSPAPQSLASGPQHGSIEEAVEAAEDTGTRSILDFEALASSEDAWGLRELMPEQQPTLAQVRPAGRPPLSSGAVRATWSRLTGVGSRNCCILSVLRLTEQQYCLLPGRGRHRPAPEPALRRAAFVIGQHRKRRRRAT